MYVGRVQRLAKGWTVQGSNPGGGEIFRTCPDRPRGQPSLLYNGYQVFPGGKEWPGHEVDPSPPSSAVGHERVELYLYSPYGPYGLYRASVPVQRVHFLYCMYRMKWQDFKNLMNFPAFGEITLENERPEKLPFVEHRILKLKINLNL